MFIKINTSGFTVYTKFYEKVWTRQSSSIVRPGINLLSNVRNFLTER